MSFSHPAGRHRAHKLEAHPLCQRAGHRRACGAVCATFGGAGSRCGGGGCVCSPLEAAALRAAHPEPFALVTPGIRPAGSASGDQARVMTPAQAIAAGASHLVIGRPITAAPDPAEAFAACCAELGA